MMILADGTASLIARQASMPERFGIRTSSRTTSGAAVAARLGALDAVAGLADDLDAVLGGEQHRQPASEQLLVVDDQHPDGLGPVRSRQPRAHHDTTGRYVGHGWGTTAHGVTRTGRPAGQPPVSPGAIRRCPAQSTSSEITP